MNERRQDERNELARWRTAEAGGREADAEAALAALFVRLPRLAPPAGFAARVAAAALAAAAVRRRRWQLAAAAGLALVAGTLGSLLAGVAGPLARPVAGALAGRLSVAALIDGLAAALTAFADWLSGAAGAWDVLADVGGALATAAGTGPGAAALLAVLAVSALALRLLSDLIATERSWSHVAIQR